MRNFDFKRYTPRPKKLLRASLRLKYRDKCGELAPISSLGNMSLCVNYPFLSNYLRNQTRILSNKTICTACWNLACTICVKWKIDRLTKKCCNRRLFYIFYPWRLPNKRNIMTTLHSLYRLHQHFQERRKQKHAPFRGYFGQQFGCHDNKPLTKCPEVSDHTFSQLCNQPCCFIVFRSLFFAD